MFPQEMQYRLDERTCYGKKEYALDFRFDGGYWWTIKVFKKKLSDKEIKEKIDEYGRVINVYFEAIKLPYFNLKVKE